MTVPPDFNVPEDVYVPGSGYGQNLQDLKMDEARTLLMAPYQVSFGGLGQLFGDALQGLLDTVLGAIISGAQAIGMAATHLWNGLVDAVTGIFEGIASVFTGGGPGGPPALTVGSTLADAYDKQQELIGKVDELMEDNAGFINLSMSKTVNVNWTANRWLYMPFDTYVTEHKNAEVGEVRLEYYGADDYPDFVANDYIPNVNRGGIGATMRVAGGHGIIFNAPGVWVIDGYVTATANVDAFRYFEVDVIVYEVSRYERWDGLVYHPIVSEYTKSRFTYGAESSYIAAGAVHKPVIIPDDGKTYAAVIAVRFQTQRTWDAWGGVRWSSLSAIRESVDTTDYGAEDSSTGTITVSE